MSNVYTSYIASFSVFFTTFVRYSKTVIFYHVLKIRRLYYTSARRLYALLFTTSFCTFSRLVVWVISSLYYYYYYYCFAGFVFCVRLSHCMYLLIILRLLSCAFVDFFFISFVSPFMMFFLPFLPHSFGRGSLDRTTLKGRMRNMDSEKRELTVGARATKAEMKCTRKNKQMHQINNFQGPGPFRIQFARFSLSPFFS